MRKPDVHRDAVPLRAERDAPERRHALIVRLTHWIFALAFFFLVFSSLPILIAHPRFYWGETGAIGSHPLFVLPLPLRVGRSGWGRSLHFLFAWVSLFTGLLYAGYGVFCRHFRRDLLPARADLAPGNLRRVLAGHLAPGTLRHELRYNVLQRIAYLAVIFVLFPLVFLSGLAMSPAITSVMPSLVLRFGGHQSARTIHFFLAGCLLAFFAAHLLMVAMAGFVPRNRAMLFGRVSGNSAAEARSAERIADA